MDGKFEEKQKKTTTIKINGKESRVHFYVFYDNGFLSTSRESKQRKVFGHVMRDWDKKNISHHI
jgi:hypothetical protein